MPTQNLLYKSSYQINENIKIIIPSVGQILDNEDYYYDMVSMLTAMPIDLMCQLDDIGTDFTTINEYDLFLLLFSVLRNQDTHLIFGDLDLSQFKLVVNEQNGHLVLFDNIHDIKIDKAIHEQIANILRQIHHLDKNIKMPANDEAKKYMIDRARVKMKRRNKGKKSSQLESLIVAMVNTEQYKYDFEGTRELSIYQFNESVLQVINKIDYDNRMYGVYTGTIDIKELSQDELHWLTHK